MEAAIALPLLLIIIAGVIEYGWMFTRAHAVANAAREGARVGARDGSTQQEITEAVANSLAAAGVNGGWEITIGNPAQDEEEGEEFSFQTGAPVRVRVRLDYNNTPDGASLGMPVPRPAWLQHAVVMMREGT